MTRRHKDKPVAQQLPYVAIHDTNQILTEASMAEQKMPEKMEKVDIPLLEMKPSNNNNKAEEVSKSEG